MVRKNEMVDYGKGVKVPRVDAVKCINDLHHFDDPIGEWIHKAMPFVLLLLQVVVLFKVFT